MANEEKKEAQYERPASQVDLEARLENDFASDAILSTSDEAARRQAEEAEKNQADEGRRMVVEGNELDNYVGTDPIYMNYANETEKPGVPEGDDNPEAKLWEQGAGVLPQHSWDVDESVRTGESDPDKDTSDEEESSTPEPPKAPSRSKAKADES